MYRFRILIAGLLVLSTAGVGFAQRMNAEQRAAHHVAQLSELLPDLTEKQKEQLKEVSLEQFQKMQSVRQEMMAANEAGSGNREAARTKMHALQEERSEAYRKILNNQQYEKYTEWSAERMKMGRKGPKGSKGPRGSKGSKT